MASRVGNGGARSHGPSVCRDGRPRVRYRTRASSRSCLATAHGTASPIAATTSAVPVVDPTARRTTAPVASSTKTVGVRANVETSHQIEMALGVDLDVGHAVHLPGDLGQDPPRGPARLAEGGRELHERGPGAQLGADARSQVSRSRPSSWHPRGRRNAADRVDPSDPSVLSPAPQPEGASRRAAPRRATTSCGSMTWSRRCPTAAWHSRPGLDDPAKTPVGQPSTIRGRDERRRACDARGAARATVAGAVRADRPATRRTWAPQTAARAAAAPTPAGVRVQSAGPSSPTSAPSPAPARTARTTTQTALPAAATTSTRRPRRQ